MKRLLTYLTVAIIMLMVPIGAKATHFYVYGNFTNWGNGDELNSSPYTKTMTGAEWKAATNSTNIEFIIHETDYDYYVKPNTGSSTITVDGAEIDMSSSNNRKGSNASFTVEDTSSKSYTLHISWTSDKNNVKAWVTSESTAPTASFKKGLYIYGEKYDGTSPSYLHYKLQPLNGSTTEYYIDLLADDKTLAGCNRYSTGNDVEDTEANNDTNHATFWADMNNSTFKLAYVATDDSPITTTYGSSAAGSTWKLQPADETPTTEKVFGGDNWEVRNIGGMYRFIVTVDANGVPQSWRYGSIPTSWSSTNSLRPATGR